MFNLLNGFAIDAFEPIAKWLALGVILAVLAVGLVLFFVKRQIFAKFLKVSLFGIFVFLLALGIACLGLEIGKKYSQAYADENGIDPKVNATYLLMPIAVLLLSLLFSAIALALSHKKVNRQAENGLKKPLLICGIVNLLVIVFVGVMLALYFEKVKSWYDTNQTMLYLSSALVVVVVVALAIFFNKINKPFDTRCISMAGITIAMSFGLSYVKLWDMPQGGSITLLSLLPIMIFSNVYGTKKGVFVCFIYGVLQAMQDPWIIHPAQFILDYPIAFASIGLAGLFSGTKSLERFPQVSFLLGGIVAGTMRFVSHVLSGVFAFPATDMSPWLFSLAYNSYVFIDIALVIVAGFIVFSSKTLVRELKK